MGVDVGAEAAGSGRDRGDVDLRLEQGDGQGDPGEGDLPPGATRWSRGFPEKVGRRRLVLIMRRGLTLRTCAAHAGARRRDARLGRRGLDSMRRDSCRPDRKSTRLNSSHANISYAVFCLKKKHIT